MFALFDEAISEVDDTNDATVASKSQISQSMHVVPLGTDSIMSAIKLPYHSREEALTLFPRYRMRSPLLIRSKDNQWPANSPWIQDKTLLLPELVQDEIVDVLVAKDNRNFLKRDFCNHETYRLQDALHKIVEGCPASDNRLYCRFYLDTQPNLVKDIDFAYMNSLINRPGRDDDDSCFHHRNVGIWTSSEGCMTPLHYDLCHGFLAQMYGRKRFILASHEDLPLLYLNKDPSIGNRNISRVDVAQWVDDTSDQRAKYPNFGDATLYVADLFPGDILYTPPGWFHHVTSIDCSMSVLMPFDPQPDEQLPVVFSM